jgi:hypothetical protein
MSTPQPKLNPKLLVWWVLWLAFMQGIFVIYFFLRPGAGKHPTDGPESSMFLLAIVPLAISAIVRWNILPRITSAARALPVFILGIALAEATCFLGLFIFPARHLELFVLSALGIFQYIPVFSARLIAQDEAGHQ